MFNENVEVKPKSREWFEVGPHLYYGNLKQKNISKNSKKKKKDEKKTRTMGLVQNKGKANVHWEQGMEILYEILRASQKQYNSQVVKDVWYMHI